MPFTVWRIYHAHVERFDGYFEVTSYNMFNREIETKKMITGTEVRRFLYECKKTEPLFTTNWTIPE